MLPRLKREPDAVSQKHYIATDARQNETFLLEDSSNYRTDEVKHYTRRTGNDINNGQYTLRKLD